VSNQRRTSRKVTLLPSRIITLSVGVLALMLLAAPSVFASSEQVGTFGGVLTAPIPAGDFPEDAQLGGAMGTAINIDGNGGVAPGTVYVAAVGGIENNPGLKVDRFSPRGEFELSWSSSERCGPAVAGTPCLSRADGTGKAAADVEIDQTTGDVYVFSAESLLSGEDEIHVYNPAGTELIAEFGPKAPDGSPIAETPNDLHGGYGIPGAIAVDPSGRVYVGDTEASGAFDYRLMIFEPETPGHYEHYIYVGNSTGFPSRTLGVGGANGTLPSRPVLNDAGDLYTSGEDFVEEYDPRAPSPVPLCTLLLRDGGGRGMTVNPETGDVYYYDYKNREVHRLSGQCGADGHFAELESFPLHPPRDFPQTMAFNPTLAWEPGDPRGVLYVEAPGGMAETGGGEPEAGGLGYVFAPAASHTPVIESESVSQVGSSSAALGAVINPKGAATKYVFEYLPSAAYQANEPAEPFAGAQRAPINGSSVGGSSPATAVSVVVSGLSPATEYRYRVVATSADGETEGTVQSFSTFPQEAAGLPDYRVYELVSPIEKHGGEPFPLSPTIGSCPVGCKPGESAERFPILTTTDGEALAYEGSSFSGQGGAVEDEYLSKRTASGWQTTDLSPSTQASGESDGFKALDESLSQALIYQGRPSLTATAPAEYANLYLQDTGDPLALTPLLTEPPFDRPPGNSFKTTFVGASADLFKVVFEADGALTLETPFAPAAIDGGTSKNNLYEWTKGQLRLVNVGPGNGTTAPGAGIGAGKGSYLAHRGLSYAVSEDGARVFWSSEAGQAYVRIDGERTVEIPDHTGSFVTAAANGAKVLLSDGRIYGDLEGEPPVEEADLTEGKGGFVELIGQSEDLSHVYFVDTAELSESPNEDGATAEEGKDNVYAWHLGEIAYIGTLPSVNNTAETAESSPGGNWLAFTSTVRLTSFDNTGPCQFEESSGKYVDGPCGEVYLYDDATGALTCPSCSPSKAPPLGNSHLPVIRGEGVSPQPHFVSDSGRMFFDTPNSLSSLDTNGGAEDVYEYEPSGIGSCAREGGCVSLISAGTGAGDSNFLGMDPSGKNVFFTTRDQLTGNDHDQELDVYDAREHGGFAGESEVQPEECRGETCQGASPAPLVEPAPGSLAFSGAGNLVASLPNVKVASPKTRVLSRSQKLAAALKACKKQRKKARASCEKSVRKKFGSKAKAKKAANNWEKGK
jgi:hypothetical protein